MLGFTKQELYIVVFLILSLLIGVSVKMYRQNLGADTVNIPSGCVEEFSKKVQETDSLNLVVNKEVKTKAVKPKRDAKGAALSSLDFRDIKININTASGSDLQKLPKIGPVIAERIVEYRAQNGEFLKLEDLTNVNGIGQKTLIKIKDYLVLK